MSKDRFYHTVAWKALRLQALRRDYHFCQPCKRKGRLFVPANTVHHRIPRNQSPELELDIDNVESICPSCHNKAHPEKAFRHSFKGHDHTSRVRVMKM